MGRALSFAVLLVALTGAAFAQQPARDTPAQPKSAVRLPGGRITGRVLASDNGRPVKRARVFITAAELPGGRGMLTDDGGVFDFTELPAGRYTLTVSKTGFVSLSYGQRRPLQAGTPLQLADGEQLKGIQFQLPRGSVIGGRVLDEDGDAMPGVMVRVMRYQYQQGERSLTPAGNAQTDDKGQYRVWGLMPGDYYVNAIMRGGNFGGGFGGGFGGPVRPGRPRRRPGRCGAGQQRAGSGQLRAHLLSWRPVGERSEGGHRRPQPGSAGRQFRDAARAHRAHHRARLEPRRLAGHERQRQPHAGQRGRAAQSNRHELRRPDPVGRRVHDHQRAAGALHAARESGRWRDAAVRRAADQRQRRGRHRLHGGPVGRRDDRRDAHVPPRPGEPARPDAVPDFGAVDGSVRLRPAAEARGSRRTAASR